MTAPIVRDIDIVAQGGAFGAAETATATSGGNLVAISGFSGTNMDSQLTAAGANATIVLSGTFNTSAASQMLAGQTLTAGSVTVRNPSGRNATLTTNATINSTFSNGSEGAVKMANNSTVSGLTITTTGNGSSAIAISADGVTGVSITNNVLTATDTNGSAAAAALFLNGVASGTVSGNTLSATGASGGSNTAALFMNGLGTWTISGNSFSATKGAAAADRAINLNGTQTFTAGSTGNTLLRGACFKAGGAAVTGSIGLAGSATCP